MRGTSSAVSGPVQYPPVSTCIRAMLWHFRGAFLAALFAVYVVPVVVDAVVPWVLGHEAVHWVIHESSVAAWLGRTLLSPGDTRTVRDVLVFGALIVTVHHMYFLVNGAYASFGYFGIFQAYKLPRTKRMEPAPGLVRDTMVDGIIGVYLTGPIVGVAVYTFLGRFPSLFADPSDPTNFALATPPTLLPTYVHMLLAALVNEVLFYGAHRAFHEVPGLYVRFHKQHHRYVGSTGFAAEYAHPVEQLLANFGPTAAYMIVVSEHIDQRVWFAWLAWRLWETFEAHSGYCFSGSLLSSIGLTYGERARFHDWHHSDNRGNYGVYWLDYVFGTMDSYAQLLADGGHEGRAAAAARQKHVS